MIDMKDYFTTISQMAKLSPAVSTGSRNAGVLHFWRRSSIALCIGCRQIKSVGSLPALQRLTYRLSDTSYEKGCGTLPKPSIADPVDLPVYMRYCIIEPMESKICSTSLHIKNAYIVEICCVFGGQNSKEGYSRTPTDIPVCMRHCILEVLENKVCRSNLHILCPSAVQVQFSQCCRPCHGPMCLCIW